jgi:hypothetical protein
MGSALTAPPAANKDNNAAQTRAALVKFTICHNL